MDARALLTAQGWRGAGHTLHPTSDRTGLTHHLLMKRNDDGSGLGSKKGGEHKAEAWWLNAFDQALKGIDTRGGTMRQTLKGGALEKITARGAAAKYTGARGLYSSFVRGGVMEGTVVGRDVPTGLATPPESGVATPVAGLDKAKEKKLKGEKGAKENETKEERRARREAKKRRKAEKQARKEAEERAAKKVEKKKAKKAERERIKAVETKEERRARRDERRKRKEEKRRRKAAGG